VWPRLPAVPPALTGPGGHPNLSAPLEPHPLFTEGIGRDQQCLDGSIINVDGQVQSSLVSKRRRASKQAVEN
jgi:hypothetical protein